MEVLFKHIGNPELIMPYKINKKEDRKEIRKRQ
jgi:hypothetical protein